MIESLNLRSLKWDQGFQHTAACNLYVPCEAFSSFPPKEARKTSCSPQILSQATPPPFHDSQDRRNHSLCTPMIHIPHFHFREFKRKLCYAYKQIFTDYFYKLICDNMKLFCIYFIYIYIYVCISPFCTLKRWAHSWNHVLILLQL